VCVCVCVCVCGVVVCLFVCLLFFLFHNTHSLVHWSRGLLIDSAMQLFETIARICHHSSDKLMPAVVLQLAACPSVYIISCVNAWNRLICGCVRVFVVLSVLTGFIGSYSLNLMWPCRPNFVRLTVTSTERYLLVPLWLRAIQRMSQQHQTAFQGKISIPTWSGLR